MKIEWADSALADLDDLMGYIRRDSVSNAWRFIIHVIGRTEQLRDFPLSGRRVPGAWDRQLRELTTHGYRVIYRLGPRGVIVTAVSHGSRQLPDSFESEVREDAGVWRVGRIPEPCRHGPVVPGQAQRA